MLNTKPAGTLAEYTQQHSGQWTGQQSPFSGPATVGGKQYAPMWDYGNGANAEGGGGIMPTITGYSSGYDFNGGPDRAERGETYDHHDAQGNFLGNKKFLSTKDDLKELMSYFALAAGGMQFLPGGAFGGPAGAGVGSAAGVPPPANPFVGTTGAAGGAAGGFGAAAGGGGGGLSSIISQITSGAGGLGKLGLGALTSLLGGGGGASGGGGLGGFGLNDLLGLIGGGVDANRQGDAAQKMLAWLNGNQGKMEGYMNPESAEYKAMWDQMSRKDAAAGRNSQYGPRTADFLANVAKAKADNTRMFTTGTSRAYADALNQDAGKYAGLSAAMQRAATGGAGGTTNLSSIINSLFGGGNSDFGTWAQDLGLGSGDWGPNPAEIDFGGIDIANMSDDEMLDWFTNGDW